jgi:hypothetical protein
MKKKLKDGHLRHHLSPQANEGHPDCVGEGYEAGVLPEAVRLLPEEVADGDQTEK